MTGASLPSIASRILVLAAAAIYVAIPVYYGGGPAWYLLCALSAAAGVLAGRGYGSVLLPIALASILILPGLSIIATGAFRWTSHAVWLIFLLGAAAGQPGRDWALPRRLRVPLALWALTIALTSAVVIVREADFTTLTLEGFAVRNSGTPAAILVRWCAVTAAACLAGILWLDYLHARYRDSFRRFAGEVLLPISAAVLVNAVTASYQLAFDRSFLTPGFWVVLGRVSGMTGDANALGALCAVWGPPLAALAMGSRRGFMGSGLGVIVLSLAWSGVWASGSRGAFVIAAVGSAALAWVFLRRNRTVRRVPRLAIAVVLLGAAALAIGASRSSGPVARLYQLATQFRTAPADAALSLWNRDGYGIAASHMILEHPWTGVGVGLFHSRVGEYSPPSLGYRLPPDNAQNWYRHQLAELGILGSFGWIASVALLGWLLAGGLRSVDRPDVEVVRWVLIAFGAIALVAMPGQDFAVAFSFWTLVFWFVAASTAPQERARPLPTRRSVWTLVWLLALVDLGATAAQAVWDMRPPVRAARMDADYSYGFSVHGQSAVTTATRAVTVVRAADDWLRLTYSVEYPDADQNRVQVEIWRDRERVVNRRLSRGIPVTEYIAVHKGERFVLQVKVDRTFRDEVSGAERGLTIKREFVPRKP